MGTIFRAAAALLLTLITSAAYSSEWYIGAGGGLGDYIYSEFEDGTASQVYFGTQIDEEIGLELILIDLGESEEELRGEDSFSASAGAIAIVPRRMLTSWSDIYVKLGITSWEMDSELVNVTRDPVTNVAIRSTIEESSSGTDLLWGGGIEVLPTKWLGLSAEYIKYTKVDGEDINAVTGTIRFRF